VQWKAGKVTKQLKLITTEVCTICSLLKQKWQEEPDDTAAEITKITVAQESEKPMYPEKQRAASAQRPAPFLSTPPPTPEKKAREIQNSWHCEKLNTTVHYTVCFKCRKDNYNAYVGCLKINPAIALDLSFWIKQTPNAVKY
jgi:hypothetical protein